MKSWLMFMLVPECVLARQLGVDISQVRVLQSMNVSKEDLFAHQKKV
jgi:hypothetical protein